MFPPLYRIYTTNNLNVNWVQFKHIEILNTYASIDDLHYYNHMCSIHYYLEKRKGHLTREKRITIHGNICAFIKPKKFVFSLFFHCKFFRKIPNVSTITFVGLYDHKEKIAFVMYLTEKKTPKRILPLTLSFLQ